MEYEYIAKKSDALVQKYGTRSPFELAREMGVKVFCQANFVRLKGMYRVILRTRCVFLNVNLPEREQKIVLAHELGHDVLHREFAKDAFLQDYMLLDMTGKPEYEANLFAANLLIEDEEACELAENGYDLKSAASLIGTDPNLLSLKYRILAAKGKKYREAEYSGDFLR